MDYTYNNYCEVLEKYGKDDTKHKYNSHNKEYKLGNH